VNILFSSPRADGFLLSLHFLSLCRHSRPQTTDMRDTLVVLNAAIPQIELILASSYYALEDLQEMLLDYDGEIALLVAPDGMMNTVRLPFLRDPQKVD
jgi:hypothetical protein